MNLPELEAWSEEMPDDVQIIGLVGDVNGADDSGQIQTAQDILAQTGVKYTNIVPDSESVGSAGNDICISDNDLC
jgi:hypothetical protein